MIEKLLEIAVITYSRSEYLARTIDQLSKSSFRGVKITLYEKEATY
jgi:hypothetical protein